MSADSYFGGVRGLVDVHLLDWCAGGGFLVSADGVVEDDDFFDAGELVSEKLLDFFVIACSDLLVICEGLLFCWVVVDPEAGYICSELIFLSADVLDGSCTVGIFE